MPVSEGGRIYGITPICPVCSNQLDGFTAISDKDSCPSPGDNSVCYYCYTPLQFNKDLSVSILDWNSIPKETALKLFMATMAIQMAKDNQSGHI